MQAACDDGLEVWCGGVDHCANKQHLAITIDAISVTVVSGGVTLQSRGVNRRSHLQPFPIDLETTISANGRKNPMISTAAFLTVRRTV